MTDIVEKLKDACVIDPHYGKSVTLTLDYDDYMEAADLITALRAENEKLKAELEELDFLRHEGGSESIAALEAENQRLRAALEEIESITVHSGGDIHGISAPAWQAAFNHAHIVARAALEEK